MLPPIHYLEHAVDVLGRAADLHAQGKAFVLVTAVEIRGGSSRELGTLAVIAEDGEMFGYLSNGCIDRDIQTQGLAALAEGAPKVLRYGAGSPFLDLTLPCGGSLTLLLDPAPDQTQLSAAHADLVARKPAQMRFSVPEQEVMQFRYAPKPMLVLAGRGSVFRAVAQAGHAAGFDLALLSPEMEDLAATADLDPLQSHYLKSSRSDLGIDVDAHSAFLTLFHDHDWEPYLLLQALKSPARFIGCLGSRKTHASRCERLAALGASADDLDRLHGPLGLVGSLRQAPLIAVSALAHITQSFPRVIEHCGT